MRVSSEEDRFFGKGPFHASPSASGELFEIYGRSFFKPPFSFLFLAGFLFARSAESVTSRQQSSCQSWLCLLCSPCFSSLSLSLSACRTSHHLLRRSRRSYSDSLFYLHPSSALNLAPVSFILHQAYPFPPSIRFIAGVYSSRATASSRRDSALRTLASMARLSGSAATLISRIPDSSDSSSADQESGSRARTVSSELQREAARRLARLAFNSRRLELVPDRSRQRKRGEGQDKGLPRKDPGTEPDDRSFGNYETGLPSLLAAEGVIESSNVPRCRASLSRPMAQSSAPLSQMSAFVHATDHKLAGSDDELERTPAIPPPTWSSSDFNQAK